MPHCLNHGKFLTELAHKCYIIGIGWISDYFTKYPSTRLDIMYPAWKVPSHPYFITQYTPSEMRRKLFFTLFLYPFSFSLWENDYIKKRVSSILSGKYFSDNTPVLRNLSGSDGVIYMYIYISQEDGVWKYVAEFRFRL